MQNLICAHCQNHFNPLRTNKKNPQKYCGDYCRLSAIHAKTKPRHCLGCQTLTMNLKFCSQSCAAKFNNRNRTIHKNNTEIDVKCSYCDVIVKRLKHTSKATCETCASVKRLSRSKRNNYVPKTKYKPRKSKTLRKQCRPYSKVYFNKCQKTGIIFTWPAYRKFHPNIQSTRYEYSLSCKFRFSISQFPLWFKDSGLIKTYGWYSTPGSRRGKRNLNGISRDHMFSISDAWQQNIEPSIIRHPANCQLLQHKLNQSKRHRSTISYNQLLQQICQFNKLYPNYKG